MSISILEVLANAQHNLKPGSMPFQKTIGMEQLSNAITLLENGKTADDDFDEDEVAKLKD